MMQPLQLSDREMQAVMDYIKSLERGDSSPPESVGVLSEELLEAMRKAKAFVTMVGQIDHEHVVKVVHIMTEHDPHWASEATEYMPSTATH